MFNDVGTRVPENEHGAINEFLREKKSVVVSDKTLEKYAYTFTLFFHDCHPDTSPAEAEIHHFEEFPEWLDQRYRDRHPDRDRRLKPKTKRTRLGPSVQFLRGGPRDPLAINPESYSIEVEIGTAGVCGESPDRPESSLSR